MALKRFSNGQRVKVLDAEHPMHGKSGKVVRCRMSDCGAFVSMDDPPPSSVALFPLDDEHGRGKHVLLYPDQCAEAIG